jgi:hypothetical protein
MLALTTCVCLAEDAAPVKFYKLDFVVKEVDGTRVLNTRSYSFLTSTKTIGFGGPAGSGIRTGNKVPVAGGGYLDVGVSIDCYEAKETEVGLSLSVTADVSNIPAESTVPVNGQVIRQNKWRSNVVVPLKKPTVIFSSDDLTSKHQMQLELTATPIP